MRGFGGVVSFEIIGDIRKTMRLVDSLKLCSLGASLGGTETLVTQPVTSSHYFISARDREEAGISDQMVRLALGIEFGRHHSRFRTSLTKNLKLK